MTGSEFTRVVKENLHFMRIALALLGLSIITGVGLVLGGVAFEHHHQERYNQAKQQLDTARQNNLLASAKQQDINRYLSAYQSLLAGKQIGEERRLDWIDALGRIREQRKLFPMEYDIASRRPYTFTDLPSASALKIFASRMSIRLPLLHESDIFTLLDDLRAQSVGLFVLDHCNIARSAAAKDSPPQLAQNLTAECAVDWLTVENASQSPMPNPPGK